jgi:hypothetical protein
MRQDNDIECVTWNLPLRHSCESGAVIVEGASGRWAERVSKETLPSGSMP